MRFLIRLDNPGRYSPKDCRKLSKETFEAVRGFQADVGNLRISNCAVELDLLLNNENCLQNAVEALENKISRLLTLRKLDVQTKSVEREEAIRLGLDLFNEERYWESHEILEEIWRPVMGVEKEILHALILLAASLVHLQKDETSVSLSIMKRAHTILSGMHADYSGIELDELKVTLNQMVTENKPKFFKINASL